MARKIWCDEVVLRLNNDQRGKLLGSFKGDDKILTVYKSGKYLISGFELSNKFDDDLILIEKWHPNRALSCIYWNPKKELYFVKRFLIEVTTKMYSFIDKDCELSLVSIDYKPKVKISFNKRLKETKDLEDKIVALNEIVDVKGDKAKGNQLTRLKVKDITLMDVEPADEWPEEEMPSEESALSEDVDSSPNIDNIQEVSSENISKSSDELITDLNENNDKKDLVKVKIDTKSEGPVEMEWDVDSTTTEEDDLDEDGQMKIF